MLAGINRTNKSDSEASNMALHHISQSSTQNNTTNTEVGNKKSDDAGDKEESVSKKRKGNNSDNDSSDNPNRHSRSNFTPILCSSHEQSDEVVVTTKMINKRINGSVVAPNVKSKLVTFECTHDDDDAKAAATLLEFNQTAILRTQCSCSCSCSQPETTTKIAKWIENAANADKDGMVRFISEYLFYKCVIIWHHERYKPKDDGLVADDSMFRVEHVSRGYIWWYLLITLSRVIREHNKLIIAAMLRRSCFAELKDCWDKSEPISEIATNWALHVVGKLSFKVDWKCAQQFPLRHCMENIPSKYIDSFEISSVVACTLKNISDIVDKKEVVGEGK
jgi:hypothetical protein